jgi:hypothetical protein
MEENKEMNSQEAAVRSAELLAGENQARSDAQAAAENAALSSDLVGDLDEPSDERLEQVYQADDAAMDAKDRLQDAKEASRQFAEAHMGPLVEAAIADAVKNSVVINR